MGKESGVTGDGRGVTGELPVKIAKRIAGICCYSGCSEPALEDSDYCAPHDAHERGRAANRMRRHRQRRADRGLCAWCGKKRVGKRRRPDGTVVLRRCSSCRKAHRDHASELRAGRGVTGDGRGVTGDTHAARIAARLIAWENSPSNEGRVRLRGGKRGAPSTEERDKRDALDMERFVAHYKRSLEDAYADDVKRLTREQQVEARRVAYGELALAVRFGMECLVRYGEECPVLHPDEIGDPDDDADA